MSEDNAQCNLPLAQMNGFTTANKDEILQVCENLLFFAEEIWTTLENNKETK